MKAKTKRLTETQLTELRASFALICPPGADTTLKQRLWNYFMAGVQAGTTGTIPDFDQTLCLRGGWQLETEIRPAGIPLISASH
ncbi:MAG: hypothetical protein V4662_12010 [Verrucomicrobiota bacterium]